MLDVGYICAPIFNFNYYGIFQCDSAPHTVISNFPIRINKVISYLNTGELVNHSPPGTPL